MHACLTLVRTIFYIKSWHFIILNISHDVVSGSNIMQNIKIDKPLVLDICSNAI